MGFGDIWRFNLVCLFIALTNVKIVMTIAGS